MLDMSSAQYYTVRGSMCSFTSAQVPSTYSIVPGIVIALFFQCMTALLGSTNRMRKGNIKWGLVAHTVALFSVATMCLALDLFLLPVSYINGRVFPGGDGIIPGPLGYQAVSKLAMIGGISCSGVQVNQWLVDGLLVSSMLNSAAQVLNLVRASTAVSLLRHLRHELLGHCFPVHTIPRFLGYVLEFSASQQRHSRLATATQLRASCSSTWKLHHTLTSPTSIWATHTIRSHSGLTCYSHSCLSRG